MSLLRFHWDFFGPDAQPTAEHFLKHLDTFCVREGINGHTHWTAPRSAGYTATLECDEKHMVVIRDALRPKRAERVL